MRSESVIRDSNLRIFNVLTGKASNASNYEEDDNSEASALSEAQHELLDSEFASGQTVISEVLFSQIRREEQLKKIRDENKRTQASLDRVENEDSEYEIDRPNSLREAMM